MDAWIHKVRKRRRRWRGDDGGWIRDLCAEGVEPHPGPPQSRTPVEPQAEEVEEDEDSPSTGEEAWFSSEEEGEDLHKRCCYVDPRSGLQCVAWDKKSRLDVVPRR